MTSVDWRALYASNQAAIRDGLGSHGVLPGAHSLPTATPDGPKLPALPRIARNLPGLGAITRHLPGAGTSTLDAPSGAHRTFEIAGSTRRALVHVPPGLDPETAVPLVCMLHGCTQDGATFAAATQMNRAADRHGFVVVYPEQERSDNQQGCWNWFLPRHNGRDAGEPQVIAGIVEALAAPTPEFTVDPTRVFAAGLSAGGAMATILAATYPDRFAAVAVHSGLPYRAATNMGAAFAAMARGAGADAGSGRTLHAAMGANARPVPSIVVHGSADKTVAPVNGEQVLSQSMAANQLAAPGRWDADPARPADTVRGRVEGGHAWSSRRWHDADGALMHEALTVEGMGHAWSGGAVGGSYTDPRGPDATEAILRFFAGVAPRR